MTGHALEATAVVMLHSQSSSFYFEGLGIHNRQFVLFQSSLQVLPCRIAVFDEAGTDVTSSYSSAGRWSESVQAVLMAALVHRPDMWVEKGRCDHRGLSVKHAIDGLLACGLLRQHPATRTDDAVAQAATEKLALWHAAKPPPTLPEAPTRWAKMDGPTATPARAVDATREEVPFERRDPLLWTALLMAVRVPCVCRSS